MRAGTLSMAAVIAGIALVQVGCGDSASDVGAPADATADGKDADANGSDTGSKDGATDGGKSHGGTTGKPCKTSDECDVTGDTVNQCAADWFANGPIYPEPVCFGTECYAADDRSLWGCDEDKGWCLAYTGFSRCYAKCQFNINDSSPPTGCVGKDACNWLGWTRDGAGTYHGTGYCFGGCTADADCGTGLKCQKEYGDCYKPTKIWVATKKVGDPCTSADFGTGSTPPNCSCWMSSSLSKGYCSTFCKMGDTPTTCPAGFTCDAQLPKSGDKVVYSAAAKGLAGACFKNCTTDADCTPLGAYCEETAGTGRKTCQPGVRPAPSDAGTGG